MTLVSVESPDAIYQRVVELAEKQEVTVDQLVSSALFEKLSAYITKDYLEERARRGSREKLLHALSQCPRTNPMKMTDYSKRRNEPHVDAIAGRLSPGSGLARPVPDLLQMASRTS